MYSDIEQMAALQQMTWIWLHVSLPVIPAYSTNWYDPMNGMRI